MCVFCFQSLQEIMVIPDGKCSVRRRNFDDYQLGIIIFKVVRNPSGGVSVLSAVPTESRQNLDEKYLLLKNCIYRRITDHSVKPLSSRRYFDHFPTDL